MNPWQASGRRAPACSARLLLLLLASFCAGCHAETIWSEDVDGYRIGSRGGCTLRNNAAEVVEQELLRDLLVLRDRVSGLFGTAVSRQFVVIHSTREEYLRHGNPGPTKGFFDPRTGEVHTYGGQPEIVLIALHESVHQLLQGSCLPVWLDEGLAEFFSHDQVQGGEIPGLHGRRLAYSFRGTDWAAELGVASGIGFYRGRHMRDRYTQAWAVVYYCLRVGDERDNLLEAARCGPSECQKFLSRIQGRVKSWAIRVAEAASS